MFQPAVSICIPAWQAEPFIDRTLSCARRQTYRNVRILVSVDWSPDQTAAICRRHAAEDGRVTVFSHSRRLGWAANCNFLLDQVESDFFFLYFHDDIILPEYTERLLSRLAAHPEAASAHCDMGHFGGSEAVSFGRDYRGPAAQRLATFLVAQRGSPLRSLTRSHYRNLLRMPTDALGGFWANIPYLMQLFAVGEAVHLPEILYHRWDQRPGGLTDGQHLRAPGPLRAGGPHPCPAAGKPAPGRGLGLCRRRRLAGRPRLDPAPPRSRWLPAPRQLRLRGYGQVLDRSLAGPGRCGLAIGAPRGGIEDRVASRPVGRRWWVGGTAGHPARQPAGD